jgi:hypothetical protein
MKTTTRLLVAVVVGIACIAAVAKRAASQPSGPAAESARSFLKHLSDGKTDEALQLWDVKAVDAKLKARIEKMAAKIARFNGIERVDVGTCEPRRIEAHEKRTGEKIDVVPVEIICGDGNLCLAVFSIRTVDGQPKIFMLESLKEWGGTASLDEELGYQH